MSELEQAFAEAVADYENGRLEEAENVLKGIQGRQPDIPDVLHLLSLVALQDGRGEDAVGYLTKAVAALPESADLLGLLASAHKMAGHLEDAAQAYAKVIDITPGKASVHFSLGNVLQKLGRLDEAIACYKRAVGLQLNYADAYYNLAKTYKEAGRHAEALAAYRDTVRANPNDAEAQLGLGNVLADMNLNDAALEAVEKAIALKPDYAEAHYNLGAILHKMERLQDSVPHFRRAIDIDPNMVKAHNNLGETFFKLGDFDQAIENCRRAVEIDPEFALGFMYLGKALHRAGFLEEAQEKLKKALALKPALAVAHTNLGAVELALGLFADAEASHRKAIEIDPDLAEAHHNLGLVLLLKGDLKEGWQEFEWRWRLKSGEQMRGFPQALWKGEDLKGKKILVVGEQGVGDEVMFAGQVGDLLERGAGVVLESEPRLVPLFERSFPGVQCIAKSDPPDKETQRPDIDYHIAAGSLGLHLRPDIESYPGRDTYLVADAAMREAIRQRYLDGGDDLLVGISWVSRNVDIGEAKSMLLADWRPVIDIPGVTFVDLQYGDTASERKAFEEATGAKIIHDDGIDQMKDLDAFAAQVAAMDLVISVSNTTVHFAGALGVPAWVMLNTSPLSSWLAQGTTSHLYPVHTLMRQSRRGDWADVIAGVGLKLRGMVE